MSDSYTYKEYASSEPLYQRYSRYQQRYKSEPRESDKELIRLIAEAAQKLGGGAARLLDIGCSSGNLLQHIRRALPGLTLSGGDLMSRVVEQCKNDPELSGIEFGVMDILNLAPATPYDIIVANAVNVYFEADEYALALKSIGHALRSGGYYLAFEWLHPFKQELRIVETSNSHPQGLKFFFRPFQMVASALEKAGFDQISFLPFDIKIDLPRDQTYGDNSDGFEDLNTFTESTRDGRRLLFRGALHQPWCHLLARKK